MYKVTKNEYSTAGLAGCNYLGLMLRDCIYVIIMMQ